jgi:membrane protein
MGLIVFFLVILFLMRDIEQSFNFLWGVQTSRSFWVQAFRHGILVIGAPILAILVLNLNHWVRNNHLMHPLLHQWIFAVALPFVFLWLVCAWLYHWIPNALVYWNAAFSGGFTAALCLEVGRRVMTWYAVNLVGQSHLYGALWVFPIILLWFYVSWVIILFGAEVSYVVQNVGRRS